MLTPERKSEIQELIDEWYLSPKNEGLQGTWETDPDYFEEQADIIGVEPAELKEFLIETGLEIDEEIREELREHRKVWKKINLKRKIRAKRKKKK